MVKGLFFLSIVCIIYALEDIDKIKDVRVPIAGRLNHRVYFQSYDFAYKTIGLYMPTCDVFSQCDAIMHASSCSVRAGCESEYTSLFALQDKFWGYVFHISSLPSTPMRNRADLVFCGHASSKGPVNRNNAVINVAKNITIKFYHKIMFLELLLLDQDNYGYQTYGMLAIYRNTISLNWNYKTSPLGWWNRNGFFQYRSMFHVEDTYSCSSTWFGPHCGLVCTDNTRRKCIKKIVYENLFPTNENCKTGWSKRKVRYIFMVGKCNLGNALDKFYYTLLHCISLDPCRDGIPKCKNSLCLLVSNGTFKCVKVHVLLTSSKHKTVVDKPEMFAQQREVIKCEVNPKSVPNGTIQRTVASWKYTDKLTSITPRIRNRLKKNSYMILRDDKVIFTPKKYYGADFLLICRINIGDDYIIIEKTIAFTIVQSPNSFEIPANLYLIMLRVFQFNSSGYPRPSLTYNAIFDNSLILNRSKLPIFIVPSYIFLNVSIILTGILYPAAYLKIRYSVERLYSIRVFSDFNWKKINSLLHKNGDILTCFADMEMVHSTRLVIIYGKPDAMEILDSTYVLNGYSPGFFKILCTLDVPGINMQFFRIKSFFIFVNPTKVFFLPFAPTLGMLTRCVTDSFPPRIGKFELTLIDTALDLLITRHVGESVRLPYVLLANIPYRLMCHYVYERDDKTTNLTLVIYHDFYVQGETMVQSIKTEINGTYYATIPQENEGIDIKGLLWFNNFIFFLKITNYKVTNTGVIMLIFHLFACIVTINCMIKFRKKLQYENHMYFMQNIEHLNNRFIVRKLNEFIFLKVKDNMFMTNSALYQVNVPEKFRSQLTKESQEIDSRRGSMIHPKQAKAPQSNQRQNLRQSISHKMNNPLSNGKSDDQNKGKKTTYSNKSRKNKQNKSSSETSTTP